MSFNDTIEELKATDLLISQARDLTQAGRLAEAEKLYQQALSPLLKMFGANSLKVCSCMLDLADVYYGQQKYFDSITLLQQVLKVDEQEGILQTEEVIMTKFRHAKALDRAGYIKEACNAYLEVLEAAERVFGRDASLTKAVVECVNAIMKRDPSLGGADSVACKVSQFETGKRIVNTKGRVTGSNTGSNVAPTSTYNKLRAAASSPSSTHNSMRAAFDQHSSGAVVPLQKPFKVKNLAMVAAAAACLLAVGLFPGLFNPKAADDAKQDGPEWPSRATAAPRVVTDAALDYPVVFSTLDSVKKVDSVSEGKAVLMFRDRVTPVSVSKNGPDIHFEATGINVTMRKTEEGLVDQAGLRLFSSSSPEMRTATAMRRVATALNEFYRAYGRYPSNQGELQNVPEAATVNPLTSRTSFPRFMQLVEKSESSRLTLSDFNQASAFVSNLYDIHSSTGEAGSLEVYASGQTLYVRGYDRTGTLVPSSAPGRCFLITLNKGHEQS